ncbi:MAG: T9SS type A sorting domain-containing protein [Bacteroidetes bacterium]|nr:T9SS type A sorting domain-containing protein [Bacteroidota bacterium]MCK4406861.1 T9SS type A sorting domain-containing protein [Bacteroidales bacterium]MCK4639639.1 T9SS type A sorting domain-containing protein [Bacteroidales bacterium]
MNCNSPNYIKILDLSNYPKGMYFIRFSNNNLIHTEKILIN